MSFSVTSSQTQTKQRDLLPPPSKLARGTAAGSRSPATDPTVSMFGGSSVGTKTPRGASYSTRAPACARSEYAGWRPPDMTSASQGTSRPSIATEPIRPRRPRASIDHLGELHARALELPGHGKRTLVGSDHDGALARPQRPVIDEPADGAGQVDADEVVAGEQQRLLDGARGDDDALGTEAIENLAGVDRDESPLVDPDRARRREHLHAFHLRSAPFVDEHDVVSLGRGPLCRSDTRAPAADHEHVRAPVL